MFDISKTIEAKSDQLNADDLISAKRVIKISGVSKGNAENPVVINYENDSGRPFKPCKTVRRILAAGWGVDADLWVGRHCELFCDASVVYGGQEVGGIRVSAMSDITKRIVVSLAKARGKKVTHTIEILTPTEKAQYPVERFAKAFETMSQMIIDGEFTHEQVINKCEQTGWLTDEQKQQIRAVGNDGADLMIEGEE